MRFLTPTVFLVVASASAVARPAYPCGATPSAHWSIVQVLPESTGSAPIDAPIVVRVKPTASVYPERSANEALSSVKIRAFEAGSGKEVKGDLSPFGAQHSPSVVFKPKAAFGIRQTLRYQVNIDNSHAVAEGPVNPTGPVALEGVFSTGTQPLEPLSGGGPIKVGIEAGEAMVCTMPGICGGCAMQTLRRVLFAAVEVPAVQGGFSAAGLEGEIQLKFSRPTGGAADEFAPFGEGFSVTPGQPVSRRLVLPTQMGTIVLCASARVSDAAGNVRAFEPLCLPAFDVQKVLRDPTPTAPSALDPAQAVPGAGSDAGAAIAPSGHSALVTNGGCSVAQGTFSAGPGYLFGFVLLLLGFKRRRRD